LDDAMRAAQRECLDAERARTERARAVTEKRGESAARERQRRRMEERRAVVEAKRAQLIGGRERLARLREERRAREADSLFADVEAQIRRSQSPDKQG
jgi:hypothetical protein